MHAMFTLREPTGLDDMYSGPPVSACVCVGASLYSGKSGTRGASHYPSRSHKYNGAGTGGNHSLDVGPGSHMPRISPYAIDSPRPLDDSKSDQEVIPPH